MDDKLNPSAPSSATPPSPPTSSPPANVPMANKPPLANQPLSRPAASFGVPSNEPPRPPSPLPPTSPNSNLPKPMAVPGRQSGFSVSKPSIPSSSSVAVPGVVTPAKPSSAPSPIFGSTPKPISSSPTPPTPKPTPTVPPSVPSIPAPTGPVTLVPSVATPPNSSTPGGTPFKSAIRTMEDDLKALKKGQSPSGVELQKMPDKTQFSMPTNQPAPAAQKAPAGPALRVELGGTEKARTLESSKLPSPPSPTIPKPPVQVAMPPAQGMAVPPAKAGLFSKKLLLVAGIVIVLGVAGYFGYSLLSGKLGSTPTLAPVVIEETPTPTPTPVNPVDSIFGSDLPGLIIPAGAEPYASLKAAMATQNIDIGRLAFFKLIDETANRFSFPAMLARFVVSHPQGLDTTDQTSEMLLSLYGALSGSKNIGLIVPVDATTKGGIPLDPHGAMTEWEKTMPKDLATLFGLNTKKQAAKVFADNTYHGVAIRYLNFSNPESTIDYAFVNSSSGLTFLVIANSRSHIYSIIDQILGY